MIDLLKLVRSMLLNGDPVARRQLAEFFWQDSYFRHFGRPKLPPELTSTLEESALNSQIVDVLVRRAAHAAHDPEPQPNVFGDVDINLHLSELVSPKIRIAALHELSTRLKVAIESVDKEIARLTKPT